MTVAVIDAAKQTRDRHDAAILTALTAACDAGLPVAEVAEGTGIAVSTVRRRIAALVRLGLVVRDSERGPVRITTEGRIAGGPLEVGAGMPARLGTALGLLPAEAYRAMLRLMLAGVIARHHLRRRYPSGWPSFIAAGDTGDGKTALARAVCRVFGWDEAGHIRDVRRATAGELLGRRVQASGREWTVEPAAVTRRPFVCLDEADKAEGDVARAVWTLMQGDTRAQLENGAVLEVAPVVYATLNVDSDGGYRALTGAVPAAYLGRSVTLDTRALAPLLADVDLAVGQLLRAGVLPRLDLATLTPPAGELTDELYRWLRDALKAQLFPSSTAAPVYLLTDRGRRLVRPEFLARLPLGLAALYPPHLPAEDRLALATVQVLLDYLSAASTVDGHVNPDWLALVTEHRTWLADQLAGGAAAAGLLPDLAAARAEHEHRRAAARVRRTARAAADDELTRERGELVEQLRQARLAVDGRRVPADWRARAGGLRAVLGRLVEDAGNAKTRQTLADVADRAAPCLAAVDQLRAEVERARTAAEAQIAAAKAARQQTLVDERNADRQARNDQRAAARNHDAQKRYARSRMVATLDEVVSQGRQMEQLYRRTRTTEGESPLRTLTALRVSGHPILAYTPPTPAPAGATVGGRLARWFEGGSWGRWSSTVDTTASFPGTSDRCPDLAEWGPNTRAVLTPVLRHLHDVEDSLRAQLARAPRTSRPDVAAPAPAPLTLVR